MNMTETDVMDQESILTKTTSAKPTTANEAASLVFPKVAQHYPAFYEREAEMTKAPSIEILDLSDEFWSLTLGPLGGHETPTVFVASESQFRRYSNTKGIYEPISETTVTSAILANLQLVGEFLPPRIQLASFLNLKNRQRLKSVIETAKVFLAVDDFFQDRRHLHVSLKNGTLQLDNLKFTPSTPGRPVRETLPLVYDPKAACPIFLGTFLASVLEPADIDLLQRYLSQVLEGINHSQTILVLSGDAGWGKSSLMKILGEMVGWKNVGIIREQLFRDEFELAHYHNKNFLFHPDMPTDFLNRKESSIFKQLVGGDPMWANTRADDGRMTLQGHYPVILACNGKPRIHLDQDTAAWLRRMVVLNLRAPYDDTHYGKLAELILKTESSGILNWLLEGRAKLAKAKLQLTQTPEQKERAATLLLASDSPSAFVRSCLVKKTGAELGVGDLYSHYQTWCRINRVTPFACRPFTATAKQEIEIGMGKKLSHDLRGGSGKAKRGWKGVGILQEHGAVFQENSKMGPLGPCAKSDAL